MGIFKITLLVLTLFGGSRGAIYAQFQQQRQDAPGKCQYEGKDYAVDTRTTLNGCIGLTCELSNSYSNPAVSSTRMLLLERSTWRSSPTVAGGRMSSSIGCRSTTFRLLCEPVAVPGGCRILSNDSAPYPHCCTRVEC